MKRLCMITCMMVVSAVSASGPGPAGKHLFILSGQSNMARLDPAKSFTPTVEAAFGADRVIVIKDAMGGQPVRRWYRDWASADGDSPEENGDLYDRLMSKVRRAIAGEEIISVTLVWMQGERDAREAYGDVYEASLRGLIEQFRDDLGREDMNAVIGRINDFDLENHRYPHWTLVRSAQVAVAESDLRAAWVNTDDLNSGMNRKGEEVFDDLHLTVKGYEELGRRFAKEAIDLTSTLPENALDPPR
ncbi:sialate O-acetylesterase [Kiritimatiella glycovorans]|uniref:Sialate O-acetylesterase domain-containing protein n=1 Tax=Kiritimatiella glycovorans TaxID=1307763 RepID=A0A0G3EEM0_9BACT|nr:sialate O-acetylesterase [Kiritimatiella glycovorans]AKJ63807.1 hypothetical protein L21SP4_00535 [Kiritimatiella glycovorans]